MYDHPSSHDPVADVASGVLADLYRAVCGHQAKAVRAYHDDAALLLLLRFDPAEMADLAADDSEHLLEGAFDAMPGMISSALEARSGRRVTPGSVSVCAERGLAVFAFGTPDESPDDGSDDSLFSLDAALAGVAERRPTAPSVI